MIDHRHYVHFVGALATGAAALFVACESSAVTAYEAPPGGWAAKSFGLQVGSEYFTTKANYDTARGSYARLTGDNNFSVLESRFRGRYNASSRISYFGGLGVGYSHALDATHDKTNSQLTEAFAGVDFLINKKHFNLVPEVMVSAPMNATDPNQTAPLTSDGVTFLRTGLFLHKPLRHFRLGAFGGLQFPSAGLAPRALYEVTVDARFLTSMTIGGGINGYESFLADREPRAKRLSTHALANAGSSRYYAYEPSLLEARAWLGFRPDRSLWVRFGIAKTLNGKNTAEGQSILISIVYNAPSLTGKINDEITRELLPEATTKGRRAEPGQARKEFKPAFEKTEHDLFEAEEREIVPGSDDDLDQTEKLLDKDKD